MGGKGLAWGLHQKSTMQAPESSARTRDCSARVRRNPEKTQPFPFGFAMSPTQGTKPGAVTGFVGQVRQGDRIPLAHDRRHQHRHGFRVIGLAKKKPGTWPGFFEGMR